MDPTAPNSPQDENALKEGHTSNYPSASKGSEPSLSSASFDQSLTPSQNQFISQTPPPQQNLNNPLQQPIQNIPNQAPVVDNSQAYQVQPQTPREVMIDTHKKSKKPLYFLLFLLILLTIFTCFAGLTYAVAYEKIKLEKFPDLQKKVSLFVIDLPFMPKTPKYLLSKTALAHQNVTKQHFDISLAVDSADLTSSLGLSSLDIEAKGSLDYTDPNNIFGNLELSFTKDLNLELRKKDKMLYFKINKIPSFLFAFLGMNSESFQPLTDKWVSYNTTPLDTEARKNILEDKEVDLLSEKFVDENFNKYLDEKIFSKMHLDEVTEEGHAVYKITLDADAELIDYIGNKIEDTSRQKSNYIHPQSDTEELHKLSDFIKVLKWEIYIDKNNYYTRKTVLRVDLEYDESNGLGAFSMGSLINPLPSNNSAKIALAVKFDRFGEQVNVEEPNESITFEEFTNILSSAVNDFYVGLFSQAKNQVGQAADARRKADLRSIQNALEFYYTDCKVYPSSLFNLTTPNTTDDCSFGGNVWLTIIPTDPDGSNYYYETSNDRSTYDLCANMEIPPEIPSSCPNSSYNYHITPLTTLNQIPAR